MASTSPSTKSLQDLITSTLALLQQFSTSIDTSPEPKPIANAPPPLQTLSDAAKLLKAHTTKISLLTINQPFTPTAISKVLHDVSGTCLPAMASAVQTMMSGASATTWGRTMAKEARTRVRRVWTEVENLLLEVRSVAGGGSPGATRARDSLASTGVVWEACDAVVELEAWGVAGLAVRKAEQYRDTVKDAIAELQEWKEGTDPETEGLDDALLDSEDEGVGGDAEGLDDLFHAANSCPKERVELRELVDVAVGKLKKIVLLYQALGKRRLKTFGARRDEEVRGVGELDEMLERLHMIQEDVDELVSQFYELDEEGVKEQLTKCVDDARRVGELARLDWRAQEDEFTTWREKWSEALG